MCLTAYARVPEVPYGRVTRLAHYRFRKSVSGPWFQSLISSTYHCGSSPHSFNTFPAACLPPPPVSAVTVSTTYPAKNITTNQAHQPSITAPPPTQNKNTTACATSPEKKQTNTTTSPPNPTPPTKKATAQAPTASASKARNTPRKPTHTTSKPPSTFSAKTIPSAKSRAILSICTGSLWKRRRRFWSSG